MNEQKLRDAIGRLRAQRDKLRQTLDACQGFKLEAIPGDLRGEMKATAIPLLVCAFGDLFKGHGAENFLTLTVGHPELGKMEVTIRRAGHKSPAELIAELKARIAELEAKP